MAFASAAGLAQMVRMIRENAKQVMACSVVLKGEYGYDGISMGVPVILGKEGVHQILEWKLPSDEIDELERAASSLKTHAQIVRDEIAALG